MVTPTLEWQIDLDGDGIFAGGGEDVSSDMLTRVPFRTFRGMDAIRELAPPQAGGAAGALDNRAGTYNVGTAIGVGDALRVRATDPTTATVHNLFQGPLRDIVQRPQSFLQQTAIEALGTLSQITRRRGLSTALFQNITTDVAIGHVLDVAGWPKTLPEYILNDLDNLLVYYGLGEVSGDALDSSTNGLDATVTIGAGVRDAAALDDNGDGSIEFDALLTKIERADAAAIQNPFDGGGTVMVIVDLDSDGEGSDAHLIGKTAWSVRVSNEAASLLRVDFHYDFDGASDGHWHTAVDAPINGLLVIIIPYNADAVGNDPTFYTYDATNGFRTQTVGSGLTRLSTPIGTRVTDVGSALVIGNNTGQTATVDGHIDEVPLFGDILTAQEAKDIVARVLATPRRLDVGNQTLLYWWLDESQDIFAHLVRLLNTEGPTARIFEDGSGGIVFKNRQALYTESVSTIVQSTIRDKTTAPLFQRLPVYDDGVKSVVNRATLSRNLRSSASLAAVWAANETVTFAGGETRTFRIQQTTQSPFSDALDPVEDTDYTVTAGTVSSATLDRTSGSVATLTIVAGVSGATLTGLQVRAQSLDIVTTTSIEGFDTTSIATHGERPLPTRYAIWPEITQNEGQGLVDALVATQKDPRTIAAVSVLGNVDAAALTMNLEREIGDRIRLIETRAGIDINAHIYQIAHRIEEGPLLRTTFGVQEVTDTNAWTWDTSEWDQGDVWWF